MSIMSSRVLRSIMRQEKAGRTVLEVREAQPDRERLEMAAARINRLDRGAAGSSGGGAGSSGSSATVRPTFSIPTRKKFHLPSCTSVTRMKAANRQEFTGTRDEVIADGYEPCKNCNP